MIDYFVCHFYRLFESVNSLIRWFPIIWRDRQFDQYFLLKILIFKLKLMEKHFDSEDCFWVDGWKAATQMLRARKMLERITDESCYMDEAFEDYFSEFGEFDFPMRNCTKVWWIKEEVEDDLGRHTFALVRKTNQKEMTEAFWKANRKEEELLQKDVEEAFGIIKNKHREWWD